ncbi:hypothetical protein LZ023_10835 [Pseudomonas silvicola]|uniref:hypothetical protein n=1 Tax=Pseudomonas sp. RIT-To-2 TaxID=3462541 RepID=UPI00227C1455|nr:hypothetical protein LZ023_10835 [Pseudomonas silvicola]
MKLLIVSGIVALGLGIGAAQAVEVQANVVTPSSGAPGTPTPTPYPQVSTPILPKAGPAGSAPLLPPIKVPGPPKDDALPELEASPNKPPPG